MLKFFINLQLFIVARSNFSIHDGKFTGKKKLSLEIEEKHEFNHVL